HPQQYGGTGIALNWTMLQNFTPQRPWLLAGGLNPDNVLEALSCCHPQGIDLSSGVERSPGDKDLSKVRKLFQVLSNHP
ncbi:MAG: N-(5'-phosphoribosyl)anthranilate isomerase, partial [Kamptonema sp. SIO4C4]|nr:N-(5'-phosphoribosyl)anthranilate isomerase [Kamptonema sp. SIO4C4]